VPDQAESSSVKKTAKRVLRPVVRRAARAVKSIAGADPPAPAPAPRRPRGSTYDVSAWVNEGEAADGFPVPPRALWRSAHTTFEDFMKFGEEAFARMLELLASTGFHPDSSHKVLDFGSGSGRFVRLWGDRVEAVWGCDLNSDQIRWCQHYLSPPYRFVQTTTAAHLPFEDRMFDLVYAGSVFTHIPELVDMWLLEIRRILQPGGYFFVTIHDEGTWEVVQSGGAKVLEWSMAVHPAGASPELPADLVVLATGPGSNVYFRREYFESLASQYFEVLSATPEARGYQTAVVLRRPPA
jgi:ubiquinone/menaquinone biosynthesis C-methylase UbiE